MRVNTRKTLDAWAVGRPRRTAESIWTDGQHIYSYHTCILAYPPPEECIYPGNGPVLNATVYSRTTTSKQCELVQWLVAHAAANVVYVYGMPEGCSATRVLQRAEEQRWRRVGGTPPSWNDDPAVVMPEAR